jgi:hypothetical protein
MRRIRKRLTAEVTTLRGSNALAVITKLNPIIRGWARRHRMSLPVSSSARCRSDLVVQRSGDIGSPRSSGSVAVGEAPVAHRDHDRQGLDARFGQ